MQYEELQRNMLRYVWFFFYTENESVMSGVFNLRIAAPGGVVGNYRVRSKKIYKYNLLKKKINGWRSFEWLFPHIINVRLG